LLAPLGFADAARGERSRVIVRLDVPARPESTLSRTNAVAAQRAGIAAAASMVVEDLAGTHSEVVHEYETLPYLAIEVDNAGLAALADARAAGAVLVDRPHAISLQETTAMIGAPLAWNAGLDGASRAVAVLDTGVDADHPFLAGRVVHEVCFSGSRDCPNGARFDEGPGAARPCTFSERGCRHGTHVAGIIAGGADAERDELSGVAPGASIVALQVFSAAYDCAESEQAPCPRTFTSDYLAALEWVYRHGAELGVAALNMSFARDAYSSPEECDADDPATRLAFENLRSIGIAPVVAAGNGYQDAALGSPACLSSAISVGAVIDRDAFAGFSNRAWFLSFAAPGTTVTSSVPGGGYTSMSGTSMAAPHVAAAFALLRQQDPTALLDGLIASLKTGSPVADPDGEFGTPVIDLPKAIEHRFGACPCEQGVDNFCLYPRDACAMTAPGGYCDPDGDGDFADADWERGFADFAARCVAPTEAPARRPLTSLGLRSGDDRAGAGRPRSRQPLPNRTPSPDPVP
jgi:subtilisin family serine protease